MIEPEQTGRPVLGQVVNLDLNLDLLLSTGPKGLDVQHVHAKPIKISIIAATA